MGPATVARVDSRLWTAPLDTPEGFDAASRTVLLLYAETLRDARRLPDAAWRQRLGLRVVSRPSLDAWLDRETRGLLGNWRAATAHCPAAPDTPCAPAAAASLDTLAGLAGRWQAALPPALAPWRDSVRTFLGQYATEQARLAALFPRTSSEIALFAPGREFTGDHLPDRQFFLTFDDGPTAPGGGTDAMLAKLQGARLSGTFFVLGQNWQARRAQEPGLLARYKAAGQCVGSHGWEHRSHARWPAWQDSVTRTRALLAASAGGDGGAAGPGPVLPLFRPPYGQRPADSAGFFAAQGLRVALWNMDSQDWNAQVSAADVEQRMTVLVLLRRHGVMLFHDIHPKALVALPGLWARFGSAVAWQPCQGLAAVP